MDCFDFIYVYEEVSVYSFFGGVVREFEECVVFFCLYGGGVQYQGNCGSGCCIFGDILDLVFLYFQVIEFKRFSIVCIKVYENYYLGDV